MSEIPDQPAKRKFSIGWVGESVIIFVVGVLIALLVREFFVQSYEIPSESMVHTLEVGDRVLVNKRSYGEGEVPARGDIIVFDRPSVPECVFAEHDPPVLIKRVIGLPGESVSGREGKIYINDQLLDEEWFETSVESKDFEPIQVGEGEILVLGDNRLASKDGTCFGPVKVDSVVGRAFTRIWPLSRLGSL
jgi:signal peptidase I